MTLAELLQDTVRLDAHAGAIEINAITADSRAATRGAVFVAVPGSKADGLSYVPQAVAAGAVAIVAERAPVALPAGVLFVQVPNVRRALALAAARIYPR